MSGVYRIPLCTGTRSRRRSAGRGEEGAIAREGTISHHTELTVFRAGPRVRRLLVAADRAALSRAGTDNLRRLVANLWCLVRAQHVTGVFGASCASRSLHVHRRSHLTDLTQAVR